MGAKTGRTFPRYPCANCGREVAHKGRRDPFPHACPPMWQENAQRDREYRDALAEAMESARSLSVLFADRAAGRERIVQQLAVEQVPDV